MKDINWLHIGVEFCGSFALEFVSAAAVMASSYTGSQLSVSLGVGLALAVVTYFTIGISGGHLSPAVTAAVAMTKKGGKDFGPMEAMLYMAAQFTGAIAGAVLLAFSVPTSSGCEVDEKHPDCEGINTVTFLVRGSLSQTHGVAVFIFEFICTFALVWVYFATVVDPRSISKNLAPLVIGITAFVAVMTEGPFTGAGLNPARVIAPAVAFGSHSHCVSPVLGTFAGGIVAGLGYVALFMFGEEIPDVYMITALPGEHEADGFLDVNAPKHLLRSGLSHEDLDGYQTRWQAEKHRDASVAPS